MKKLYERSELWFALSWIIAYCIIMAPIREEYGDGSIRTFAVLYLFAMGILLFVKRQNLEKTYGFRKWAGSVRDYWYFLPLLILATGNIWDGFALSFRGSALVLAILSMFLVGFVEEMIFRGFLFRALLKKNTHHAAIAITAVTFGVGHIVNLFAGQATPDTFLQIVFAIAIGYLLTMVFYSSGSLIPCILLHGTINALAVIGADNRTADWIYILVSIPASILFCIWLYRRPCILRGDRI